MAQLCIFPSVYEPFGLASVEAMATGAPVILSPGFSSIISGDPQAPAAFRTAKDDPTELADLINSLIAHPERAAEIGERGREHVRSTFSWTTCAYQTIAVYEQAMAVERGHSLNLIHE